MYSQNLFTNMKLWQHKYLVIVFHVMFEIYYRKNDLVRIKKKILLFKHDNQGKYF